MPFIEFDPKKHRAAFKDGKLYEVQTEYNKEVIASEWIKVISQEIYEDALNNPIFFAVKVGAAKPIRKGLVETIKEATESFVWDGVDGSVLIVKGGPGSGHHGHTGRPGSVGGSSPGGGKVTAMAHSVRGDVELHLPAYEKAVGLGPCGPVAALVTERLREEGLDARMAFSEYEYGPTEFEIGGHYITVVMKKGKPSYIVDTSNYFSKDALEVVPATHKQWGRFGELEWDVKGGDGLDFISELWDKGDIEWWQKRLT